MAKFEVSVEEISYGFVTVEAETEEEAYEKAEEMYFEGMVNWTSGDFSYKSCTKIGV